MGAPKNVVRTLAGTLLAVAGLMALSVWGSLRLTPPDGSGAELPLGAVSPASLPAGPPETTVARVADRVSPSVVFIVIENSEGYPQKNGSGVIVRDDGYIVTNAHVVAGAERVRVVLQDGSEHYGEVFGSDTGTDVAVIKIEPDGGLPTAVLGDSDRVRVGEFVLALGAPFSLVGTVSVGIVSALDQDGLGIARFERFIVTDARINRGNSGGPLVNLAGEVIGINTAIIADENGGGSIGVGFAIPVDVVEKVAGRLIARRRRRDGGAGEAVAGALAPTQLDAARLAERVRDSVALIVVEGPGGETLGRGAAVVMNADGYLVTNAHVVEDALSVRVMLPGREALAGEVIGIDTHADLALIKVDPATPLPVAPLGDSRRLSVGDEVVAVGAAVGSHPPPSPGTVTAKDVSGVGVSTYEAFIATSAQIHRGHSGGPLLDAAGLVVGINTAVLLKTEDDDRDRSVDAYAIPIAEVEWVVDRLVHDGTVVRPSVGFAGAPTPEPTRKRLGLEPGVGCVVTLVDPAVRELQARDVIVEVDGVPLRRCENTFLQRLPVGTEIELTLYRDGERRKIKVVLGGTEVAGREDDRIP